MGDNSSKAIGLVRIIIAGSTIIKDGKILLLFRKDKKHYEFSGGKVEPEETLEQAAIRETKEELGVNVKIVRFLGSYDFSLNEELLQSNRFLVTIVKGTPKIMEPDKFDHIIWMPIADYASYPVALNVAMMCKDIVSGKIKI